MKNIFGYFWLLLHPIAAFMITILIALIVFPDTDAAIKVAVMLAIILGACVVAVLATSNL